MRTFKDHLERVLKDKKVARSYKEEYKKLRIAYELNQSTENIGARRLSTVMEKLMEDISFSADEHQGETITIDRDNRSDYHKQQ